MLCSSWVALERGIYARVLLYICAAPCYSPDMNESKGSRDSNALTVKLLIMVARHTQKTNVLRPGFNQDTFEQRP